jgi:peptidoglycan/xylan/chitin deacetylase (PgdA/CDA1 family)
MPLGRSLRILRRRALIYSSVAVHLDEFERWRERRQMRQGGQHIRVLYFHGTPAVDADGFRRQLIWLQRHFRIIDFAEFEQVVTGSPAHHVPRSKPLLLLTFDDGLLSNYEVAAPMLEAMGLRALFFVVPDFSLRSGDSARAFCRDRILQRRVERAMSPDQIADLTARGHTIGNHTFSHANLRDLAPSGYHHEVVESAAVIESWTGRPVTAFAWPFRWNAISPEAFHLAADRHRFCFAPCAGRTAVSRPRGPVFWRTGMETYFADAEMRFQCSGLADLAAARRRRRLIATLERTPIRAAA